MRINESPDIITAEGGMGGTYVHTIGKSGLASLTISSHQTQSLTLLFTIR